MKLVPYTLGFFGNEHPHQKAILEPKTITSTEYMDLTHTLLNSIDKLSSLFTCTYLYMHMYIGTYEVYVHTMCGVCIYYKCNQ